MARRQSPPGWVVLAVGVLVAVVVIAVALGSGAAAAQEETGTTNVTVYATADGGFENASEIEAAIDNGTVYPTADVKVGQTLVVAVHSERLAGDLEARNGSTTERFFAALEDSLKFGFVQTDAEPNVALTGIAVDPESTTVYRNGTTTYLSIDTDAVDVGSFPPWEEYEPDPEIPLSGKAYAVALGYEDPERKWDAGIRFYHVEAEFHRTDRVVAPEQVMGTVRRYVGPEENLVVRATFENRQTMPTQLDWNRSSVFSEYTLDFSDVPPGTEYTLELVHDGVVVESTQGRVREPAATLRDAEVTATEGNADGVVTLTANLSHSGVVVVRDEFGARIGVARVRPGRYTDMTIPFRFDDGGEADTAVIEVEALRQAGRIERGYPGDNATVTLDVSEFEWEATDWDGESRTGEPGAGDSNGSAPDRDGSTETTATPDRTDSGGAGDTATDRGDGASGDSNASGVGDGGGADAGDDSYTVGTDTSEADTEFGGFGVSAGVVGLVAVLGGTGYLLRRRWPGE